VCYCRLSRWQPMKRLCSMMRHYFSDVRHYAPICKRTRVCPWTHTASGWPTRAILAWDRRLCSTWAA
jgi:hypothetical protein